MTGQQQPVTNVYVTQSDSNGLGIAGFVVSLVGLLMCGLLCPIGMLISFFGLFKSPRGMAVAGTIIGAIGSAWLAIFGYAMILAMIGIGQAVDATFEELDRQAMESVAEPASDGDAESELDGQDPDDAGPDAPADDGSFPEDTKPDASPTTSNPLDRKSVPLPSASQTPKQGKHLEEKIADLKQQIAKVENKARWRTWKTADGKYQRRARFVTMSAGTVTLEKEDGSTVDLRLDVLSEEDQQFIIKRQWRDASRDLRRQLRELEAESEI